MEFAYSSDSVELAHLCCKEKHETHLSKFDKQLCSKWDAAMDAGYFRYQLHDIRTKILPGKYEFVAQLNIKRATERRKAEQISSIDQPFNHEQFNFTKIKKHEILFEMKPNSDINKESNVQEYDVLKNDYKDKCNYIDKDKIVNDKDDHNPHLVVINVSPLEYCNVLLVPHVNSCYPQILNPLSIQLALEMMLLSSKKSFRVGWNSLCAFASVNHLHFHAYYLDYSIYAEIAKCQQVSGTLYETTDYPVQSFVLQLKDSNIQKLTKDIYKVTSYLHANNTAHNLFVTRGDCLEGRPGQSTVRVYIWPRQSSFGAKQLTSFNAAVCELSGHIPVKCEADFETLTEETVVDILKGVSLADEQFENIKKNIQILFK